MNNTDKEIQCTVFPLNMARCTKTEKSMFQDRILTLRNTFREEKRIVEKKITEHQ